MAFRPETAEPMGALANVLLKDTDGLSPAERELIATHVSYLNDCFNCHNSHGEIACYYLNGDKELVDQVRKEKKGFHFYFKIFFSNTLKAEL
jgi:alkylhydroperoxidase family enzyme